MAIQGHLPAARRDAPNVMDDCERLIREIAGPRGRVLICDRHEQGGRN